MLSAGARICRKSAEIGSGTDRRRALRPDAAPSSNWRCPPADRMAQPSRLSWAAHSDPVTLHRVIAQRVGHVLGGQPGADAPTQQVHSGVRSVVSVRRTIPDSTLVSLTHQVPARLCTAAACRRGCAHCGHATHAPLWCSPFNLTWRDALNAGPSVPTIRTKADRKLLKRCNARRRCMGT